MKIGSLCSGYGGLEEGVRSVLGGDVAWHSEIDPGAVKILNHRYPGVPNIGDMTAVDWAEVEPIDVLCGGTPCQDLSAAGKRLGMREGTRSNLWVAMRDAITILRPGLVVWENVRGALSAPASSDLELREGRLGDRSDGPVLRALGRVLGDLSELGFDAEWVGLRAADVGAPHGRFRVFLVAWPAADATGQRPGNPLRSVRSEAGGRLPRDDRPDHSGEPCDEPCQSHPCPCTAQDANLAASGEWRLAAPGQAEGGRSRADTGRRDRAPAADAARNGRHERRTKSARVVGGSDAALGGDAAADAARPTRRASQGFGPGPGEATGAGPSGVPGGCSAVRDVDWGQYEPAIRRWERLSRPAPNPTERGAKGQPRLSPAFVEWLMGLPAGWVTDVPGLTRNEMLKALGNGVCPPQAAQALRLLLPDVLGVAA